MIAKTKNLDFPAARVGTEQMARMHGDLPPVDDATQLQLELRLTPKHLKPDALQEAWVAYLEGRNPARAVNTFCVRERRHAKRNHQLWPEENNPNGD